MDDATQLDDLYDDENTDERTGEVSETPRSRQAHPLDLFSLTAGLLALVGGGLYLLGELTGVDVEPGLVAAAVVVLLGVAGIVLALRRREG